MLLFKKDLCVGCEICSLVCSLKHTGATGLAQARIKVSRNYPSLQSPLFKAVFCRQCRRARCVEACPTGALRQASGVVNLDISQCTGCGACVDACPFHAIWVDGKTGIAFKCDLCGGDPVCVAMCPHGALVSS